MVRINSGGKPWSELVDSGAVDALTYPWAKAGRRVHGLFVSYNWVVLSLLAGFYVLRSSASGLLSLLVNNAASQVPPTALTKIRATADAWAWNSDRTLSLVGYASWWWLAGVLVILLVSGFITTRRWAYHEQRTWANDRHSRAARKRIINRLRLERRISELRSQMANGKSVSVSSEAKLEALQALRNMTVSYHTRRSLNSNEIERHAIIVVCDPPSEEGSKTLLGDFKSLNVALSKATRDGFSFGEPLADPDGSRYVITAVALDRKAEGKRLKRERAAAERNASGGDSGGVLEDETSFPTSLLKHDPERVERQTVLANRWAQATQLGMDKLLATKEQPPTLVNMKVSGSFLTLDYVLPFSLQISSMDEMARQCDRIFNVRGCRVLIHDGNYRVIIPLVEKITPSNRLLYIEAFGGVMCDEVYK